MASYAEVAACIMEHLCTCSNHGYTWGDRWGDGDIESIEVDGKTYYFAGGDRDCSSSIISAYQAAGLNVNATYTGNMIDGFLATGMFEWKDMSFIAQRGDIYLNIENHTAMCLNPDPDTLGEFCINEFGECYGGEVGDQTGGESRVAGYYDFPWDGILHFIGGEASGGSDSVTPVRYRVAGKDKNWFSWVTNMSSEEGDDFAGDIGIPIYYLEMDLPGWFKIKTKNGWLEKGCTGDGTEVIAVQAYYESEDPVNDGYHSVFYRVSCVNEDYLSWVEDDRSPEGDGYAGDDKPIDRIQACIGKSTY